MQDAKPMMRRAGIGIMLLTAAALAGCAGRPSVIPNKDETLRKTSAEFAADAAVRHPYKSGAPRGGQVNARADIDYTFKKVAVVQFTDDDWKDIEVWVNQGYVVALKNLPKGELRRVDFQMLYDGKGTFFPLSGTKVEKVEILRDGKMYDVPIGQPE